jgi:hypothetical protein
MEISLETLLQLVENDEFGLSKPKAKPAVATADEKLLASFNEISDFVKRSGHEPRDPDETDVDPIEGKLFWRLDGIRLSSEKSEKLREHDKLGLLAGTEAPSSIDDILALPDVGSIIENDPADIFTLRHVPGEIDQPEEKAEQKPCEDFDEFRPLFELCHRQLRFGERKMIPFSGEGSISAGQFYVLRGALVYVSAIGEDVRDKRGKVYARTRTIHDNGTESNFLVRSLGRALLRGGKRVTEPEASSVARLGVSADAETGRLYVLRSLSEDPQLEQFDHLHKIGFTRGEVDDRIRGAAREATFLSAPVEIVATYAMPRSMAPKVEHILHTLFAVVRLDAVFSVDGEAAAHANEWFAVPFPAIDEAIDLINAGTISNFRYDPIQQRLVLEG